MRSAFITGTVPVGYYLPKLAFGRPHKSIRFDFHDRIPISGGSLCMKASKLLFLIIGFEICFYFINFFAFVKGISEKKYFFRKFDE